MESVTRDAGLFIKDNQRIMACVLGEKINKWSRSMSTVQLQEGKCLSQNTETLNKKRMANGLCDQCRINC